jgi:hypothetical protein
MQDQWYGDKRDLVKWGVLVELARRHRLKHILQVPYKQNQDWSDLDIDGESVKLPQTVVEHFRDPTSASKISCSARIEVFPKLFDDRSDYHRELLRRIHSRTDRPGIVFLDPDTGLQPPGGRATKKHVLTSEIAEIWGALNSGDLLVLYQHANRSGTWIKEKKRQFEKGLHPRKGTAKIAHGPEIASDVAFFFLEKGE